MSLSSMEQQLISYLLIVIWVAVEVVLIIRGNATDKSYLRRLPPVDGVPLDTYIYVGNDWLKGQNSPLKRAYRQPQADPELEQLRQ